MPLVLTNSYLADSIAVFRQYKALGEKALAQVPDEALPAEIDPESNSLATIVKHLSGNMRSRWTDFLTTDGEKPDRNRDAEFTAAPATREELLQLWESGWACVFVALEPLSEADLQRTVTIRGERHSVLQAINRQVAHYAYHIGQMVFLARHLKGGGWQSLSIPKGKSAQYNQRVGQGEISQR